MPPSRGSPRPALDVASFGKRPSIWRRLFDSYGVRAFAMHAPYKQDLASLNETVRRLAVHTTIRSFAGFSDVGGHTVIIHPNSDDGP